MKKIIDAHMHLSNIETFKTTAKEASIDYTTEGLLNEYEASHVILGIGMGVTEGSKGQFPDSTSPTPMGLDLYNKDSHKIVYCIGVNPYTINEQSIKHMRDKLAQKNVVGIKIYLGYYPFYAYDELYDPIYQLAKDFSVPIVFHTGDIYSERGLLKYSHPLQLDEVAVKHREINFVMAHFGDPWVLDGAEVVYKNPNVYADLSGLSVGDNVRRQLHNGTFDHLKHAITYCDHYEKLIFGTDWPITKVKPYIEFIKHFIPTEYHEDVFYHNAIKVFPKILNFIKED